MENNFKILRKRFSDKLYRSLLKYSDSEWNFFTDSCNKNLKNMTKFQEKYFNLFKDKFYYEQFLKIDKTFLSIHETKQLKNLLKYFEEELNNGEDLKILREEENKIAQKFNSYIPKIDNKEISKSEITKILQKESDIEIRKKAYKTSINGGDLIAEDLKNLIIKRNKYAKKKGYNNYFEYKLKENYEVDLNELENLLNDVYKKSKNQIKEVLENDNNELKNFFKVKNLESYHYAYLTDNNPEKEVNKYLKTKEQIVDISKNTYINMGYDVNELVNSGKIKLDLFPRKGKNTHGFCFDIDAGKNTRILANLTNNTISIDTLNHEMGHCVYTLGISRRLPFLDRNTYPAMTEAIAMMMGDLQKREDILKNIVPMVILEKFKNTFKKDEIKFISHSLLIINFEKEMYKNPEQDLRQLWHNLQVKYKMHSEKEELDNSWANIPHFLSHPAYYQNYFRATLIKAQIYEFLTTKFGKITENKKVAAYLKNNLFKYGISLEETELIEKFTRKKLSVNSFINSIL